MKRGTNTNLLFWVNLNERRSAIKEVNDWAPEKFLEKYFHPCNVVFQGDPDFVKYWNEVETNKEKYVASGIWAGFEELKKGQTVLHALSAILRGANKADPSSVPPIKTFGSQSFTSLKADLAPSRHKQRFCL